MTTERTKDVIIPLVGTAFAFIASILSAGLMFYIGHRSNLIDDQLNEIQKTQFAAEQAAKASQFDRESERQYVSLVYQELISQDEMRQKAALTLVTILEPDTGQKLIAWIRDSGLLLEENKAKSLEVEESLEKLKTNRRFVLYLHLGQVENRQVPARVDIERLLKSNGFINLRVDDEKDRYGPGVDYFHDTDRVGAEIVADILNTLLGADQKPIVPRKQSGRNPEGWLGIWF
jgi:hypothetical protein